jgi:tRNA (mo5U34)-methyltransferase
VNTQHLVNDFTPERIHDRVRELGNWFQNLDLHGIRTAPEHFLGNYPEVKWRRFAHAIPEDLRGKTVLDIGCNAGFYSIEMKRRGAERVLGVDFDPAYLAQARFAAEVLGLDIEFQQLSVYDVAGLGEKFDVVIFMGVLYHLRHPLLALDLIHEHVAKDLLVFQSMQRGSTGIAPVESDYDFWQTEIFERPDFPQMYFIEHRYAHDPTNWWIPNRAGMEAMLRSAGFEILQHPEDEVYICRVASARSENDLARATTQAKESLGAVPI